MKSRDEGDSDGITLEEEIDKFVDIVGNKDLNMARKIVMD
jgi:hypothetical protein